MVYNSMGGSLLNTAASHLGVQRSWDLRSSLKNIRDGQEERGKGLALLHLIKVLHTKDKQIITGDIYPREWTQWPHMGDHWPRSICCFAPDFQNSIITTELTLFIRQPASVRIKTINKRQKINILEYSKRQNLFIIKQISNQYIIGTYVNRLLCRIHW